MRSRIFVLVAAVVVAVALPASVAQAARTAAPRAPKPAWLTPKLHDRIVAAGAQGVRVGEERLNLDCPGLQGRGVSAGGCIVDPSGCSTNFIFTDGSSQYVGTARHCVDGVGQEVIVQVDTVTVASVGRVAKMTPGGGEPGQDFALIRIDPAVAAKWGVSPAIPIIGGPRGVYTGCSPQVVENYGHGYGFTVAQGKPMVGLATNWGQGGYGWTGLGNFGDSGSPVIVLGGQAAGNLTHFISDPGGYPGSDIAGMRMTAILQFAGVSLVNADGSTSSSGPASCTARLGGLFAP